MKVILDVESGVKTAYEVLFIFYDFYNQKNIILCQTKMFLKICCKSGLAGTPYTFESFDFSMIGVKIKVGKERREVTYEHNFYIQELTKQLVKCMKKKKYTRW